MSCHFGRLRQSHNVANRGSYIGQNTIFDPCVLVLRHINERHGIQRVSRIGCSIGILGIVGITVIGVIYGAKILGTPLRAKLPGIDFASALMAQMGQEGKSVFLLGAKPGVADAAAEKMRERFPGLVIAGTNDGYFQDDDPVVEKINAAQPDLLLVCLGAPKQELWMQRNAPRLRVGLMPGLGGSLDVFAGNVKRAPKLFQKLGLEWFYRLIKEPKRIGRMMKLPKFLFAAIGCKLRGKKHHGEG